VVVSTDLPSCNELLKAHGKCWRWGIFVLLAAPPPAPAHQASSDALEDIYPADLLVYAERYASVTTICASGCCCMPTLHGMQSGHAAVGGDQSRVFIDVCLCARLHPALQHP
jgi:hypothetical protein